MGGFLSSLASVAKPAIDDLGIKAKELAGPAVDYMLRSGWASLESKGAGGKMLADTLRDQRTAEAVHSGQFTSELKNVWDNVPTTERLQVKTNPNVSPAAAQAFAQTQQLAARNIQDMSIRGAKVVTGGQVVPIYQPQDFFPKVLTRDVFKPGSKQEELVDWLVQSAQIPRRDEAQQFVNKAEGMMYGRKGAMVMHDLMGMQIPDQFLEQDPKIAFAQWGEAASKYITKADYYGVQNQRLNALVDTIGATDGFNARQFASDAITSNEYGYYRGDRKYYSGKTTWEETIRNYEGMTKLSQMAISETSQPLNALVVTNARAMGNALKDVYQDKDAAVEFTLKSGALLSETLRDWKAAIHGKGDSSGIFGSVLSNMLHYTGFDSVRDMNLILSANAGKHYTMELADRLIQNSNDKEAVSMLKVLGLEPSAILRQGGASQQDLLFGARRVAELTQFIRSPLDMPLEWGKNPYTRILTLYKSFVVNQAKLSKDFIFTNKHGKMAQNVAYFSLLFPVVGELVGDVEALARGQNPADREDNNALRKVGVDNKFALRYADNLTKLGHIGMFFSMLGAFNRDNILGWLTGPIGGDIEDTGRVGRQLLNGGSKSGNYIAATAARRIPVVGAAISNHLKGK